MTNGTHLTATSPSGWGFVDSATGYTVEAFFKASPSATYQSILTLGPLVVTSVWDLDPPRLEVLLDNDGIPVAGYRFASAYDTSYTGMDDFEWHHIAAAVFSPANETTYVRLWFDGTFIGEATSGSTLTRMDRLTVGEAHGGTFDGQIAHVAIYPEVLSTERIRAHAEAGLGSHAGETTTDRFQRLCNVAGLPAGMYSVDGTGLSTMSAQPTEGVGLLDLIRQCAEAELGVGYVDADGKLTLAPRDARYGAGVGLTLDARTQLGTAFTLTTDDGLLVNDVTASRPGGATIRVVDDESVAAYDTHDDTVTLYVNTDEQVTSLAEWRVFTASQPGPRCTSVTVDAVAYEAAGGDVVELLTADMGTRLSITNLPSDTSADATLDLFIEGVSVRLDLHGPVFTFTTSPVGASGSVWIIEDPVYGLIETGGVIAP
jgi:Concanavalin A-like lectin/glucanases superfamily